MRHRNPRLNFVIFALIAIAVTGCSREEVSQSNSDGLSDPPAQRTLVIRGSSTLAPLIQAIAERFHVLHPGVQIKVATGGSLVGIRAAREGAADIGMSSRALNDSERDLHSGPIARDGACF